MLYAAYSLTTELSIAHVPNVRDWRGVTIVVGAVKISRAPAREMKDWMLYTTLMVPICRETCVNETSYDIKNHACKSQKAKMDVPEAAIEEESLLLVEGTVIRAMHFWLLPR